MKHWLLQHRSLLWALFCSFALCLFGYAVVVAFSRPDPPDRFSLFVRIIYLFLGLYYTTNAWWRYRQQRRAARHVA